MVATPDEYLAAVPEHQHPLLDHLRSLIQESVPALREDIRWGMLCYEDSARRSHSRRWATRA